jgi:hypothetical protein
MAQQAGVDVLTHVPLDQALDEASVARMAADGRILIPTLTMMETLVSRLGLPAASYAAARASVAAAYRAGVLILVKTPTPTPTISSPWPSATATACTTSWSCWWTPG